MNCWGCDHFSAIAESRYEDCKRINRDLERLRELIGDRVERIAVMGGEPLLHLQITDILQSVREIFPEPEVRLSTNGTLLLKMDDNFWNVCRDNKVTISVTKYPITYNYEDAEKTANRHKVKYTYYNEGDSVKTSYHIPLDTEGKQDTTESFINCFHANDRCNMLSEGRLWTCTVAPNMRIFAKHFGVDIPMTEDDGIDIYSVKNSSGVCGIGFLFISPFRLQVLLRILRENLGKKTCS